MGSPYLMLSRHLQFHGRCLATCSVADHTIARVNSCRKANDHYERLQIFRDRIRQGSSSRYLRAVASSARTGNLNRIPWPRIWRPFDPFHGCYSFLALPPSSTHLREDNLLLCLICTYHLHYDPPYLNPAFHRKK